MTLNEAKALKIGDQINSPDKKKNDGITYLWKVIKIKTWKTKPEKIEVALRRGYSDYNHYTETELETLKKL